MKMEKANESYIKKLIEDGTRADGRKFDEYREISVETGVIDNAEGSARVKIGKTTVLAGIKMAVGKPFPDTPNDGVLIVNAEFAPIASVDFDPGPPGEDSIEMSRIIDRAIRESHTIDTEKLVIEEGEKVWMVNVDIQIMDHDGNLRDAGALAAMAALMVARKPKYDGERIVFGEYEGKLPLTDSPTETTIFKIADNLLVDATAEEEYAVDALITIGTTKKGDICAIQKSGEGYFTEEELLKAAELAIAKGKELQKHLKA
ncbi:MAG: exosome complex protein Rrp42 [Candidatus Aenigmarchaeota archaeon]|nr:exosome complex protein Rrp42 [Candidatus Aenigmarchaeota archaeon]